MNIQNSKTSSRRSLRYIFVTVSVVGLLVLGLMAFVVSQAQKPSITQTQLEFICNDMVQKLDSGNEIADDVRESTCKDSATKAWTAAPDKVGDCIGLYIPDEFLDLEFFNCLRERGIPFLDFNLESLKS
jgi:hypothetical protein